MLGTMGSGEGQLTGPDLEQGILAADVPDGGSLVGHAGGESVLVARRGERVFAIGATCTHYGGPLGEGLVVGDTVRCPWHHACFSLETGAALAAPGLNAVPCWEVEQRADRLVVLRKKDAFSDRPGGNAPVGTPGSGLPSRVVIVGAGAAGAAAAEMLRREGFDGSVRLIGEDADGPVDRPNLSKDYLAGTAPEEWIPLRPRDFYAAHRIDLLLGVRVTRLDPSSRMVFLSDGGSLSYDALLLATGAEPVRLPIPGADLPHVFVLRSLADTHAILAKVAGAKRAVVAGASFIGLEVAASLRARGLEVHVVAPESRPLERVLGKELGDMIRALHEEHGVVFHLEDKPIAIDQTQVTLAGGEAIAADLVVMGVGVRPDLTLAEEAGIKVERGVVVDAQLRASVAGVWAAGDIASYPDPRGGRLRIEHWVVAERQGQTAARSILGQDVRFDTVPFFWSQHYDVPVAYVGHAAAWDRVDIAGDPSARDCAVAYRQGDRTLAVATVMRDDVSLRTEAAMQRGDEAELRRLIPG